MILIDPITSNIKFYHFAKLVCQVSHCKLTILFSVVNKYFVRRYFELM